MENLPYRTVNSPYIFTILSVSVSDMLVYVFSYYYKTNIQREL